MSHSLQAIIAKNGTLAEFAVQLGFPRAVPLNQDFELLPLMQERLDEIGQETNMDIWGTYRLTPLMERLIKHASLKGPVAFVITEYLGGSGSQGAAVYENGEVKMPYEFAPLGPINRALNAIGVTRENGEDQFDSIGLDKYRDMDRWLEASHATPKNAHETPPLRIVPRTRQKYGGLIMAVIAIGFIVWSWVTRMNEGRFDLRVALIFPAFAVIGLGAFLFPGYNEERYARIQRGETDNASFMMLTPRWLVITALAIVAAVVNFLLLKYL